MTPRILAFAGSLRQASWNHKLAEAAARCAQEAGADVTVIRLSDHPLPLYDQDHEDDSGLPEQAVTLKTLFRDHHGLLIASPEYNGAYTAALKNVIDWVSRPQEGFGRLDCFAGKAAGLLACSPGGLGGSRGLPPLAAVLSGIGVTIVGGPVSVPAVHEAFNDDGTMATQRLEPVCHLARRLVHHCRSDDSAD